jgi:acetoin utilization protein AcuB
VQVQKIMSTRIVSVAMDDSLRVIKDIFENLKFHHLLVIEKEKLVGIISDRDLFKALSPNIGTLAETSKDTASLNKLAHQVMTRKPICISPEANIYDAISLFNQNRLSCLPVVDIEQKPVGILSWRDIFKAIEKSKK